MNAVVRGTAFRYSLSEDAKVMIRIERALPGRLDGRRCRAPSRRLRSRRACTRFVLAGTLRRVGRRGANKITFTGRIGRRALGPGRYRAVFSAMDHAGNASIQRSVFFTVLAA